METMSLFPQTRIHSLDQKAYNQHVDCVLIGANFATLVTAIQLADAGLSVQVFEMQSDLGHGDSGKSLLPASLSFTDNLFRLHASLGEEKCSNLLHVMLLGGFVEVLAKPTLPSKLLEPCADS